MQTIESRRGPVSAVKAGREPIPEIITTCANCSRLKVWGEYEQWVYLVKPGRGQAVSSGMCNDCLWELYPEFMEERD